MKLPVISLNLRHLALESSQVNGSGVAFSFLLIWFPGKSLWIVP